MKTLLLSFIAFAFTLAAGAQSDPVSDIFDRYANKEGFTVINISGDLVKMISGGDKDDNDLRKLTASVTDFRILVHEQDSDKEFPGFHNLIFDKLDKGAYKELMTVKENDQDVNIMMKEENEFISELLMIVSGDDDVLMRLRGHFKMSDLASLTGMMHMDAFGGFNPERH